MSSLIAVTDILVPDFLKRHALLFDKFTHPFPREVFAKPTPTQEQYNAEVSWLYDYGIVVDLVDEAGIDIMYSVEPLKPFLEGIFKDELMMKELVQLYENVKGKPQEEVWQAFGLPAERPEGPLKFPDDFLKLLNFKSLRLLFEAIFAMLGKHLPDQVRVMAATLRNQRNLDAYPLLTDDLFAVFLREQLGSKIERSEGKENVLHIVLNRLPEPDESVSWEQIIDYRNDPDSRGKMLALRNWMHEVARSELTQQEIEDKLDWLIYDYERHVQLHRMKYKTGTIETILTVGAEFLENMIKFKWSDCAKALFSLKHGRITLLEAEMGSPGSEVAYIAAAKEKFGRSL